MKEEILQNKLIARFMDLEQIDGRFYLFALKEGFAKQKICAANLEYHTSFDWLMPACKKAINIQVADQTGMELKRTLIYSLCTADLSVIYPKLVEFVRWHSTSLLTP